MFEIIVQSKVSLFFLGYYGQKLGMKVSLFFLNYLDYLECS